MQTDISNEDFKKCLGSFVTGVTVVTLVDASRDIQGITINSFSSLSMEPKMVSFNLGKASYLHHKLLNSDSFAVNILSSSQAGISRKFAQRSTTKWQEVKYTIGLHGCPIIDGSAAFIECLTNKIYDGGDHSVITGKIVNLQSNSGAMPLVYHMGCVLFTWGENNMKIGVIGCTGRMGKAIIEAIILSSECEISGGVVRPNSEFVGLDIGSLAGMEPIGINSISSIDSLFERSDAVIDFSNPTASLQAAHIASNRGKIHIIGTTGFSPEDMEVLKNYAKKATIVWSPNMSVGVNLLFALTEQVAKILDDSYDIEILEMHHCRKVDAPSGTALALGKNAAAGRGVELEDVAVRSRDGIIGTRERGEIGFATLRGGDVVGDHTVIFAGDGERVELTHKASNRKIYARGAVKAALWAKVKKPGFYSMKDVLYQSN